MEVNSIEKRRNDLFKILLLIYFGAITVWIVGQNINVYHYAVVGAIFEILWLPMIIGVFFMPFISFYFWYKEKFKANSKFLYLLLMSILLIIVIKIT